MISRGLAGLLGMTTFLNITMSLDGFVAGPNITLEQPLGEGGEELHEWALKLASWRQPHGHEGGETGADDDLVRETQDRTGAFVMGRKMFSSGEGPWEDDPKASGWWGDEPPFGGPVFVVTHHEREPLTLGTTTFTFVDGVEPAVLLAREAAGPKDVQVCGGAEVAQQALNAGLLDELFIHIAPRLLGGGVRLLDEVSPRSIELIDAGSSPSVTHVRFAVK
jgi:dihydrofolate reductase